MDYTLRPTVTEMYSTQARIATLTTRLTDMADQTHKPLRSNPFDAYRDPNTGRWVTVIPPSKLQTQLVEHRPEGTIKIAESNGSCKIINLS